MQVAHRIFTYRLVHTIDYHLSVCSIAIHFTPWRIAITLHLSLRSIVVEHLVPHALPVSQVLQSNY